MNQTAQGLASFGRGPDSMLVHMAPSEVKSLQQLAMAHGGSLTINPQTGLPEAGFLSSLLPTLIGAGLSIASGGTLTPMMAAMMTGGGYGLATGSLKKGLMAGLGAYGGAGLGSALAGAGATTAGATANALGVPGAATGAGSQAAMLAAQNQGFGQAGLEALGSSAGYAKGAVPLVQSGMQSLGAGAQGLLSEQGRNAFMQNIGGAKGLGMAGLAAAAPMLLETTTKQPDIKQDTSLGQRYKFGAGSQTPTPTPDVPGYDNQGENFGKEKLYFTPSYTPIDDETARRMYGHASGGPVEDMSNANAIGMNTGYPQAAIDTGAYATPYQQPISRNVVTGTQGAGMNPYTGQAQFADGGITGSGNLDLNIPLNIGGGGSGGGSYGGGGSYPFANSGGAAQPSFTGQNNTAGGGYANPFASSAGAGAPPSGPGMNIDPQGVFSDTFKSNPVGAQNIPAGISQLISVLGGKTMAQGNSLQQQTMDMGPEKLAGLQKLAAGGLSALAQGGISHLGDYSDGGRLLRGPGDGISDSIPAMIGKKQPARLADGEFVVPARIVSELGNGSTEAGARKLYAMMDRVQKARGKTVGKGKVAANSRSAKYLPA